MGAKRWTFAALLGLLLALVAASQACSGSGDNGDGGDTGAPGGPGSGGAGGGLFPTGGGLQSTLILDPPEATIIVDNGTSTPVQFTATLDGAVVHPTEWAVDYGTIADVDAQGLVTATNTKGGMVTVTATLDDAIGTATVFVHFHKTVNSAGISAADQSTLENASTPDPSAVWAYPYDGTVWPQKLLPPELMWNGTTPGDVYFLHFTGQYVDLKVFAYADPPSRWIFTPDDWIAVNESGAGDSGNIDVHVARLVAQQATVVIDHKWRMAHGSLRGTVYYWANSLGRVVRIKPGAGMPDDFLAAAGVNGCTTCHTVSADGLTLTIGGDDPTSVFDLLNNAPVLGIGSVGKPVRNWAMPAVSPDGRFLVENNAPLPGPPGGSDAIWDTMTGVKLTGKGLDGMYLDMPAFGRKGHKLVYVDHGSHDLRVYDFDLQTGVASNPQVLVGTGGDPALNGIAFPSVSPTLKKGETEEQTMTVYHRGVFPNSLDTRFGPGDLYLASVDQAGLEWRLANTNGDAYPFAAGDRDKHNNYEPTFAPQAAGGFMWVVFTSRRTYGNRLTGDQTQVKQLWVAAIDPFPIPGEDPSHPAFWVPGQDPNTLNMRGFWALDPCIQQGNMCTNDAECCDGKKCENGLCGGGSSCAETGEFCEDSADCCNPEEQCIAGVCTLIGPQ
jgi:Big-like domain-containing protein